uniref:Serpentine Receptor, class BC (Class B-like) n=1 Tax=Steinernema glaseri TaxID=37863 RepID=A0A1I8AUC3_9BILA
MLKEVVIAEFCVIIVFGLTTIIALLLSFRMKPVKTVWKQCPPLCLILVTNGVAATLSTCFALQWILFNFGAIRNVADNVFFLSVLGRTVTIIQQFNSCSEIGLFAQRIFHILQPLAGLKKFYLVAAFILSVMFFTISTLPMYSIIFTATTVGNRVPDGCFSLSCMPSGALSRTVFGISLGFVQVVFNVSTALITTCLGVAMLYLLRKRAKNDTSNDTSIQERQKSSFSRYVFLTRFFSQTLLFNLDIILSTTAHILIGNYIGPFAVLGAGVSFTVETLAYYSLFRKYNVNVAVK